MPSCWRAAHAVEQVKAIQAKYPERFIWSASTDITKPDAVEVLDQSRQRRRAGLRRTQVSRRSRRAGVAPDVCACGELDVPILVHFQEVPHFEGEGVWSTGFKRFEAMLKAYPKTKFIGHADAFWANVSADYANEAAYPTGPIKRGGITDKLLGDYANLFGDLSANSGNNALSRDPEFTADFLARHQNKLVFGSDCSCQDGNGGGVSQNNNPAAARMRGKCVARETLTVLKQTHQARCVSQTHVGKRTQTFQDQSLKENAVREE